MIIIKVRCGELSFTAADLTVLRDALELLETFGEPELLLLPEPNEAEEPKPDEAVDKELEMEPLQF